MGVMADTAGVGALSPRDLIKAYTITRSSVNRAAVATWRATAAGLQLPDSHTDETVRPEGAFAYWLLSGKGQDYLNDAERGTVNEESAQNAVAIIMKPFKMNNTLGEDMVRQWQDAVDHLEGGARPLHGRFQIAAEKCRRHPGALGKSSKRKDLP